MTDTPNNIIEKLAILKAGFTSQLPDRIREIETASHSLQTLQNLAHKLSGSAGTYGLPNLGLAAHNLDKACKSLLGQESAPVDEDLKRIDVLIALLQVSSEAKSSSQNANLFNLNEMEALVQKSVATSTKDIIVVEDDTQQAKILEELLSNFGFLVTVLHHPSKLRNAIRKKQPSVVIMDIAYDDSHDAGLVIIKELRAEKLLTSPVIFVSVRDDFLARLEAVRGGSDGFMVKPIDILKLVEMLNDLFVARKKPVLRILVVDDDPDIGEFCRVVLEDKGLITSIVKDPFLAVDEMLNFKPDLIILDVEMPGCDGFELGAAIRQMGGEFLLIPILFLTANNTTPNRIKAAYSGSDDFMSKPINAGFLTDTVIARAIRGQEVFRLFLQKKLNEERFTAVARNANEAIILSDYRGLMLSWNQSVKTIFGYDREEILGKPAILLIPEKHREAHLNGLARVVNNKQEITVIKTLETEGLRKDGSIFPMALSLSSWVLEGTMFFSASMSDITQRKTVEKQLTIAKNEAIDASLAKSQFLTNMSHELRTPLTAIVGFSDLILRKNDQNEKVRKYAGHINNAGKHLSVLIDEILDLAKIEKGVNTVSLEKVHLREIFEECYALIAPMAKGAGINLSFDTNSAYIVLADYTRLQQSLLNLLTNAVKYNKAQGNITVDVVLKNDNRLRISVIDTGVGLNASQKDKLFNPFERLGAEHSDIEGTGIGLAITQKLVETMNGNIGVSSTEDEGSTFWIELPLGGLKQSPSLNDTVSNKLAIQVKPLGKRLIYVEDNPVNLELMQDVIHDMTGYKLQTSNDGVSGLELILKQLPDLVLLDINLPIMNGFDVLKNLRNHSLTKQIPVLAVTANAMSDDIEKIMEAGFDGCVIKPIETKILLESIEKLLE